MEQNSTIFDRSFNRQQPAWKTIMICVLLLSPPLIFGIMDGNLGQVFTRGQWRGLFLSPVIIIYIILVSPLIAKSGDLAIQALKPLIKLEDPKFTQLVYKANAVKPLYEFIAFAIGFLIGIFSLIRSGSSELGTWLYTYYLLATSIMYGILIWTIFIAVSSTRVNAALHRQPMEIDILNPTPFEPVGRQSLLLALVFIGGITISLIFTFPDVDLTALDFWISNALLVIFAMLIFFLGMRPTHRLLVSAKNAELHPVQTRINSACRELATQLERGRDTGQLASEINALATYEQRLLSARTWPYNTSMLRTLFFSVFIPLGSILARIATDIIFP